MRARLCGRSCLVVWLSIISLGAAGADSRVAVAAKNRDWRALSALLAQRADVNGLLPDGTTALHWAVLADARPSIDELIRAGANVNTTSRYKITPLALACMNGSAPVVAQLLAGGADPNASPNGESPLMVAARTGDVDTIRLLLAHGAAVNARETELGQTALMWAVAEGNADAAKVLIESGADVNVHSNRRRTAARVASGLYREDLEEGGSTALLFAVRKGDRQSVRALLSAGVDPNEKTPTGSPLSFVAIMNGHYDLAVMLVDAGADPNATDAAGRTVLHNLVETRNNLNSEFSYMPPPKQTGSLDTAAVLRALLERGADPNARLQKMSPPDNMRPVDLLDSYLNLEGGTPFLLAARNADVVAMRILVEGGANPRLPTTQNSTPLLAATGVSGTQTEDGPTPAMVLEAVRLTLELGNDVNAANVDGQTPLHGAVYLDADHVIQFLVDHGANPDAKDVRGRTPLALAESFTAYGVGVRVKSIALLRKLAVERSR